ncbi:hypothetical protein [Marinoscillum furvescens]|uniref:Uncharacterized protein n=1 Tax=Marinoscillum furvescens DSM 4134 TaxID=1122208 RepID=A0A3D9L7D0_MARFU|nr:hypothetical protein [Marinoscillum furvescens]REE01210.1 hypothetical protein C7460_104230 [Marinoscillum furvescens DSM 4134]
MSASSKTPTWPLLSDNGYALEERPNQLVLRKSVQSGKTFSIILIVIGILILTFGMYFGLHYATVISGLFFIGVPFIYERWKYPSKITIDQNEDKIELNGGLTFHKSLRFNDISSLQVDEAVVTSDVSPFKDGYQDFIYTFNLLVGKEKQKFLSIISRSKEEESIKSMVEFLSQKLRLQN